MIIWLLRRGLAALYFAAVSALAVLGGGSLFMRRWGRGGRGDVEESGLKLSFVISVV
jgi:hypothetical protein